MGIRKMKTTRHSKPPRNPESQIATMINSQAIFSRKSKDQSKHQPRVGGGLVIWRNGVRYAVTKDRKLVRML